LGLNKRHQSPIGFFEPIFQ